MSSDRVSGTMLGSRDTREHQTLPLPSESGRRMGWENRKLKCIVGEKPWMGLHRGLESSGASNPDWGIRERCLGKVLTLRL
jgi:hypothetical protein